jgi:4-amino-4-deoxy-L-arabinose transferase-like glycosyltransferase
LLVFTGLTLGILILRLPTFFEPPWHTDEGIFAAVATRVLQGGELYADAWESKPPLFLYFYAAIFKIFGTSVLALRIAATFSALATQWALYAVGCRLMSRRQALIASTIAGVLLAVPFWEGQLALTEVFAILPSTVAVLCVLIWDERRRAGENAWWLFAAGLLFGTAFLLRQTAAVVCVAIAAWLLLSGRPWLRPGLLLAAGALAVIGPVVAAFAIFGTFHWFWDANVGFFMHYVPSGREIPVYYRPLIFLPVLIAGAGLLWHRHRGRAPGWSLPAIWLTCTLAAALLTGRPYPHYFLQVVPPLALLVALMLPHFRPSLRPRRDQLPGLALAASIVALWLAVVVPEFKGNFFAMRYTKDLEYYANFAGWVTGIKDRERYDLYFDKRVYLTQALSQRLEQLGSRGEEVYIWGEYPWVYALSGSAPATRYTMSFYVLLIPYLDAQLYDTLARADPRFIVTTQDAWPRMQDDTGVTKRRYQIATRAVNSLIAERYEFVGAVGRARIFERTLPRPLVDSAETTR